MANQHLNLFRHYSASDNQQVLENNLTRALALCLQHEALFLYLLLGAIVQADELRGQLDFTYPEDRLTVDVQQEVKCLEACTTLYAVALTETELRAADYAASFARPTGSPVTDLIIRYKDVLVLVEVKRTDEDCLAQLKRQVEAYQQAQASGPPSRVSFCSLTWSQVVRLATNARNLQYLRGQPSPFVTDLVQFFRHHRPHWDEVLPFKSLDFAQAGIINEAALYKRLRYIQQKAFDSKLLQVADRIAMPIDAPWASEVITYARLHHGVPCLRVTVWPGNTIGQGRPLFARPLGWMHTRRLPVAGQEYAVEIESYLKFSHFNGYVYELPVPDAFMRAASFERFARQWKRKDWPTLEAQLTQALGATWTHNANWERHFLNSARSYATLSLGFALSVYVPYAELQQLDTSVENWQPVASSFHRIIEAMRNLVNGPASQVIKEK